MQHRMDMLNTSSFWKIFQSICFCLKKLNIKHSENKFADSTVGNTSVEAKSALKTKRTLFLQTIFEKGL